MRTVRSLRAPRDRRGIAVASPLDAVGSPRTPCHSILTYLPVHKVRAVARRSHGDLNERRVDAVGSQRRRSNSAVRSPKAPRGRRAHAAGTQFLPQDVAFSIHLSDNRFAARPLATTVVSPQRKLAPWVDISSPQPASARFFAKCLLSACALYIPLLNNWELTDVNGRAVKWVRRTVVEPLL